MNDILKLGIQTISNFWLKMSYFQFAALQNKFALCDSDWPVATALYLTLAPYPVFNRRLGWQLAGGDMKGGVYRVEIHLLNISW